jgi:hypothetical protein
MVPRSNLGSLTKEPPLAKLDATMRAISPGMRYNELLEYAGKNTHPDAPGLVAKRFLLLDPNGAIVYDRFLSLASAEGLTSPRVRKVMYLVWALRDERLRRFICERVADRDGKWKINTLRSKANSTFLEEWLSSSSAKKARSNIEFFLQETGIYDPAGRIHLELDDGWLPEAMQVAAQHEPDPATRTAMTAAPAEFLVSHGWHGLVNATPDELGSIVVPAPEGEPLEDKVIELPPGRPAPGKPWKPTEPKGPRKKGGTFEVNHVAVERASRAHQLLERLMADGATARGYQPLNNENIDLYFETPHGTVLAEMKSCHRNNVHSQIRRGVSQLLEYRYFYRELLGRNVSAVLVIETPVPRDKAWLVEYLATLGITLIWKEPTGDRFVTAAIIPDSLRDLAFPL